MRVNGSYSISNHKEHMFSTHTYPKAVLGSSGSHLYPRKGRTNPQVLEADNRPPYCVSWRTGNDNLVPRLSVLCLHLSRAQTKEMNKHVIQFPLFVSSRFIAKNQSIVRSSLSVTTTRILIELTKKKNRRHCYPEIEKKASTR